MSSLFRHVSTPLDVVFKFILPQSGGEVAWIQSGLVFNSTLLIASNSRHFFPYNILPVSLGAAPCDMCILYSIGRPKHILVR